MAIVSTCRSWITGIGRAALMAQPSDHYLAVLEPRPQRDLLPSRPLMGVEAISAGAPHGYGELHRQAHNYTPRSTTMHWRRPRPGQDRPSEPGGRGGRRWHGRRWVT